MSLKLTLLYTMNKMLESLVQTQDVRELRLELNKPLRDGDLITVNSMVQSFYGNLDIKGIEELQASGWTGWCTTLEVYYETGYNYTLFKSLRPNDSGIALLEGTLTVLASRTKDPLMQLLAGGMSYEEASMVCEQLLKK